MTLEEFILEDRIQKIQAINEQYDLLNNGILAKTKDKNDLILFYLCKMVFGEYFDKELFNIKKVTTGKRVLIGSSEKVSKSEDSPCLEFDENKNLIAFYPLSVVDEEWKDWFIEKYIKAKEVIL